MAFPATRRTSVRSILVFLLIRDAAAAAGLSWGGNFSKPDVVHFYEDPTGGNKKRRQQLIDDATSVYESGSACTCP